MKTIKDIINEGRVKQTKFNNLTKLYMLTIMIPYEMWKEYKVYDDFFGELPSNEKKSFEQIDKMLTEFDNTNKRTTFKALNFYFYHLNKLADYMLKQDLGKQDKRIWEEIKSNVDAENYNKSLK